MSNLIALARSFLILGKSPFPKTKTLSTAFKQWQLNKSIIVKNVHGILQDRYKKVKFKLY